MQKYLTMNSKSILKTAPYSFNKITQIALFSVKAIMVNKWYYFMLYSLLCFLISTTDAQSKLLGMTEYGGVNDYGVIFEMNPSNNTINKKIDFDNVNGSRPQGSLTLVGNKYYGMTYNGGGVSGVIFEWDPNTNIYTKKININSLEGYGPKGSLTLSGGKLYGMTYAGGFNDNGTIFEWNPTTNVYTQKIKFQGPDGSNPFGSLTYNNGKFYGMTHSGGAFNLGVIFEWNPNTNIYTKKIDFADVTAYSPCGSLSLFNGKFYGMSNSGGINGVGAIFEWDPVTNIFNKKIDFDGNNGKNPQGDLIISNNTFYGLASGGGLNNCGVIFKWNPVTNIYTKKIDLSNSNGRYPFGSLTLANGKFYGMTSGGGANNFGVVFEWDTTNNTYTKLADFSGLNGKAPLYGHLEAFNAPASPEININGNNTSIQNTDLTPDINDNTYFGSVAINTSKINQFIIQNTGNLALTITNINFTGISNPASFILNNPPPFPLTIPSGGSQTIEVRFLPTVTGLSTASINFSSNDLDEGSFIFQLAGSGVSNSVNCGKFYGMTYIGGQYIPGVIFEWDPSTNTFIKKIDLSDLGGGQPIGSNLTMVNNKLYGMTWKGGTNGLGVLFEWDPSTNTYTKKIDFNSITGNSPRASSLTVKGSKLYGMTYSGGVNDMGVIFEWDPATNTFSKKIDFDGTIGSNPTGNLILLGNKFYGMTYSGGLINKGVIFEWDPISNIYIKKIDLDFTIGCLPNGSFTLSNGKLYGMTGAGGIHSGGVIFQWDPVTNIYTKKIELSSATGYHPKGNLTLVGNKFYGMTNTGGANNLGVIFEWDTATNLYTMKQSFSTLNGSNPYGSLTFKNAKLYGMTNSGGTDNGGTIFEWNPYNNTFIKKYNFKNTGGYDPLNNFNPFGDLVEYVCLSSLPEINLQGNGITIVSGNTSTSTANLTNYGDVVVNSFKTVNFYIQNSGTDNLVINSISFTGTNNSEYSIINGTFPMTITPGSSQLISVKFSPLGAGIRVATINIYNNDSDEGVYNFAIQGRGLLFSTAEGVLCSNGNTYLTASLSGTVFQWQRNTGSGFINLPSNSNYSGTNTSILQLTNIPSQWYNYLYRCVVDGVNGNSLKLKFLNTWIGVVNSAWENAANWSCGTVPDSDSDVLINNGDAVIINSNASCGNILLLNSSTITVNTGYTFIITH